MKYQEDDRELKISKCYLMLPQCVLNWMSDFGLMVHRLVRKQK
jgi:hypothetical protein